MHRMHKHSSREDSKPGPERSAHDVTSFAATAKPIASDGPTVFPRSSGSVTRMRTPRSRAEDQRVNLRRSYQSFLRKAGTTLTEGTRGNSASDAGGAPTSGSTSYQSWPVRPYAASV